MDARAQSGNGWLRDISPSADLRIRETCLVQHSQHVLDRSIHIRMLIRLRMKYQYEIGFHMNYAQTYSCWMAIKDTLKGLMERTSINQNELADRTRVPQPTINRILSGESKDPRHSTVKPLADFFGITVAQLRGDEPLPDLASIEVTAAQTGTLVPEGASIAVYDSPDEIDPDSYVWIDRYDVLLSAGCGNVQWVINQKDPISFRARWFQAKRLNPNNCKALYVRGRSMEPKLEDWDTVLIDISQVEVVDGDIYAVCLENEFYIKTLERIPGGLRLKSENPDFQSFEVRGEQLSNLKILGKKVWRGG